MKKQIVHFVVDKRLDLANHFIALDAYKRHTDAGTSPRNEKNEKLLKMPPAKRRAAIAKEIDWYYSEKRVFLEALADDINRAWAKIEKDFVTRIEKVHGRSFAFKEIKGVLSSAQRFGYRSGKWFATSMFRNKFAAMDTGMHEMMHFMFHKYYQGRCKKEGLTDSQIWDVKEAFTVLLNLEFGELRFDEDFGYPQHRDLRAVIKQSWLVHHDFEMALEAAIHKVKEKKH